jgi:hypothetical protein
VRDGLIKFEDIAVIDDKGDSEFQFPHIFVDFHETKGPFFGFAEYLRAHEHRRESLDGLKRIDHFPSKFDAPRIGTVHSTKLKVEPRVTRLLSAGNASMNTLYDVEGRFDFLAVADVIAIEGAEDKKGGSRDPLLIQITHKRMMTGKGFMGTLIGDPTLKHRVEEQVGREATEHDQLRIVEFKLIYAWVIERALGNNSVAV